MSVAARLCLPEAFQTTLLVIAVALTLASYLPSGSVGGIEIPKLKLRQRRALRIVGPVTLLLTIGLLVPISALRPKRTDLALLAADATAAGDIDVVIANSGTVAALLTAIELEVTRDRGAMARSGLSSSARYHVPVDDLVPGRHRTLVIRHVIAPASMERILIAPDSSRSLTLRMRIFGADGTILAPDHDVSIAVHPP